MMSWEVSVQWMMTERYDPCHRGQERFVLPGAEALNEAFGVIVIS